MYVTILMCHYSNVVAYLCASQEQERRRKAEAAAHSALNGPRVRAYEYAGPDFEVMGIHWLVLTKPSGFMYQSYCY